MLGNIDHPSHFRLYCISPSSRKPCDTASCWHMPEVNRVTKKGGKNMQDESVLLLHVVLKKEQTEEIVEQDCSK